MGVDAGSVYSSIRIRLTDLDNDLKGVYARLGQLEQNITKNTTSGGNGFKNMFAAVLSGQAVLALAQKGFQALTGFIKSSTEVARDSQEMISKYDVVFAGMGDASEEAAKKFSDSFDLAGATAKEMLGNTGNLLQGMGATREESLALSLEVNTLAGDLASFTNNQGGSKAASEALTKALLGEKESMKTLGIAILDSDVNARVAKNGQSELTGTALKLAKAQATLQLITEQSKNAIGDYARTQDSAANVQKRAEESTKKLQIALGTALNPAATLAAGIWAKVSGALAEVITKQNELGAARDADKKGLATYDQRILLLNQEKKELETLLGAEKNLAQQYGITQTQEGKRLEQEITAIDMRIGGIQRAKQTQALADRTKAEADKKAAADAAKAAADEEERARKYKEASDLITDSLEGEKSEYEKIQDKIDKLSKIKGATKQEEANRVAAITALQNRQAEILQDKDMEAMQREREAFELKMKNAEDLATQHEKDAETEEETQKSRKAAQQEFFDMAINLSSSLASLTEAIYNRQKELLDQRMQDELEAAGVAEDTVIEKAQTELDAALASGNAEEVATKEKALKKAKIEEDYAKKLADLQYESAMVAWGFNLAQTTAQAGMAILNAFNAATQMGALFPFAAPIYEGLAIAAGAASITAVAASMPVKKYATGGIVEAGGSGQLAMVAENGYGEGLFNTGPTGQLLIEQFTAGIARALAGNNYLGNTVIQLDGKEMAKVVTEYQRANKV